MSFALGFYEIFSYAIPGFLYILIANGFLQLLKLPHMDLGDLSGNLGYVVLMAIFSYIAGHIGDTIAYRWYRLFNRRGSFEIAINKIKAEYPELNIDFSADDQRMLYSFIKHNNLALAEYLDKFNAIGILLQNLSLGLFLFALTQVAYVFITGKILEYSLGALLGFVFSFVAIKRSMIFKGRYFRGIFEQALHYGTSVEKMFKEEWTAEKATEPPPPPAPAPPPARKPRTRAKASAAKSSSTK